MYKFSKLSFLVKAQMILAGLFGTVAVMAATSTTQPSAADKTFDWTALEKLINGGITNIDDLLARLPQDYKGGYALMYRTRALGQERVSESRPRVLLFGTNAKLVIAYNSHVTGQKARPGDVESIETLAFDDATGRSFLREIVFNGRRVDFSKVKANPQRCLACHTQSPKGIVSDHGLAAKGLWDPYNSWAGAFGSLSRQGIDFIKLGTNEEQAFNAFLAEKKINPRYSFLTLNPLLMSQLPASAFIRTFDLNRMNDAIAISDGRGMFPNQALGMYLADYNFVRVGNILAAQDASKRAAFQYLIKGISLDENFAKSDIDERTNTTDVTKKVPACLEKIASFLPAGMSKVSFENFASVLLEKERQDYLFRKAAVEMDNMGLSKLGAGFDPKDPYDENAAGRGLDFDSVNVSTKFHLTPSHPPGMTGNVALFYLLYLMDIPSQDISTAITRGNNVNVDGNYILSGNTALYYGNASRCYSPDGMVKSSVKPYDSRKICFTEAVEEFFTHYLPQRFYKDQMGQLFDAGIDKMTCDQLAVKSRAALGALIKGEGH